MMNFDRKSLTLNTLQDPNVHSSVAITPIADAWNLSLETLDTSNRIADTCSVTILKFKAIREDETHLVPISEVYKQCPKAKVIWQAFYVIDIQTYSAYQHGHQHRSMYMCMYIFYLSN